MKVKWSIVALHRCPRNHKSYSLDINGRHLSGLLTTQSALWHICTVLAEAATRGAKLPAHSHTDGESIRSGWSVLLEDTSTRNPGTRNLQVTGRPAVPLNQSCLFGVSCMIIISLKIMSRTAICVKKIITVWRFFFRISCSPLWLQSPALTMKWDKPNLKKSSRSYYRRLLDISILVPADHVWLNGCVCAEFMLIMEKCPTWKVNVFSYFKRQWTSRTHGRTDKQWLSVKSSWILFLFMLAEERERDAEPCPGLVRSL